MYEWLSHAAATMGAQHARTLARHAVTLASACVPCDVPKPLRREVMGLEFPGPVGLAAGFDKHGELYPALTRLGFGFAEIGSVIPKPESRRSRGLEAVLASLVRYPRPHPIPLGASLSMNRKTPFEQMPEDYLVSLRRLWSYADYFVINLGVRAGPDLHLTEHRDTLCRVLAAVQDERSRLARAHGVSRPLAVKLDQHRGDHHALLSCVRDFGYDGLVLSGEVRAGEEGRSLAALDQAMRLLGDHTPVISVGGIRTPRHAADHLAAGASLVEIYSGLVAAGPLLPRRINAHWMREVGGS